VSARGRSAAAVLAVDGGNSKTDVALLAADGRLLAAVRGPTISHQQVGLAAGTERLIGLAGDARARAGLDEAPPAAIAAFAVAGADTPADVRRLTAAFAATGLARETFVENDAFAPVHAGSERGWGVSVICGAGVNAAGIAPDGRRARLAAYGDISGDWGGGRDLGAAALGAAVRARDGRGPRTTLETLVPAHFGLTRPMDLTNAIEHERMPHECLRELSPVVFAAARDGDLVARSILDRMADEVATMALAIVRRLHLTRRDVDVVLAGGVFRAEEPVFEARIASGVHGGAPLARIHRLDAPPVLGPALLGIDRLPGLSAAARHDAVARARATLVSGAVVPGTGTAATNVRG
jgi:N-acetylglucosamine kinase-like BadF-type ATPase